ncbi:MAG TPA: hypothetical protein VF469_31985 [Kofleriaceae bacterium]
MQLRPMQLRLVLAIAVAACSGSGAALPGGDAAPGPGIDAQGGIGEAPELAGITLYHNNQRPY